MTVHGLRIRLARHGIRNQALYHLVVMDRSKARNALPLEKLGEWDPIPQVTSFRDLHPSSFVFGKQTVPPVKERRVIWNEERIKYWLAQGAEPSDSVTKLLELGGILKAGDRHASHFKYQTLSKNLVKTASNEPVKEVMDSTKQNSKASKPKGVNRRPTPTPPSPSSSSPASHSSQARA
ncbi:ribosomal protein S16 domain-containing protein [Kockovaella imperatae]|uniref:Ribosomal protein S16 domain-containing protein n=1 Tax=Kockovaella imperatae TaxID=4999 RepID=A0A1Y1UB51_9TREE|nr:ribosomal protein S16 domain-containing protein [Kockovaella imperatae]ORX34726.1 ribosomal protein S16 domain-containing protein [Kockovaella imperatae]